MRNPLEDPAAGPEPGDFAVVTEHASPVERLQGVIRGSEPRWRKYVHTFRLVSVTPLTIVEAMPGGTVEVPMHYPPGSLFWSAGIITPTAAERAAIIAASRRYAAGKVGYSFLDYAAIGAWSWHIPYPDLAEFIAATGHMCCSQEVDQEQQDGGAVALFTDGRPPGAVAPMHLAERLSAP